MEDYNNLNGDEPINNDQANTKDINNNNSDIIQNNNKDEIPENDASQNEEEKINNNEKTNMDEKNVQKVQNSSTKNSYTINANPKKKSNVIIIIVVILIIILLLGCLIFGGVMFAALGIFNFSKNNTINKIEDIAKEIETIDTNTNSNSSIDNIYNTSNNINSTSNTNKANQSSVKDAKESTKENPLEKGTWGIASKYSTESKKYEDVYVKVTNIIRGEDAKKVVQNYASSKSYFKYEEPKEGLEWVVLDYDLDYANFTKSSLGANADVTSSIRGIGDHSSVIYNGKTYILSSRYIGSSDYVKTQTTTGKIAFQMPIGCSDYIVELGSYSGSKAYFKCE